jgi:Xaa-Pro aminopeptidase
MTDRLARARDVMTAHAADALLVSHPTNRRYFSGFPDTDHAPDESSGVMLVTRAGAILYASPTNLPWATATMRDGATAEAWERPWQPFIGRRLRELGLSRVLFEDRALTVADHGRIGEAAEGVALLPAGNDVHLLRAVKDDDEIAAIAEAARITDAALARATAGLAPGITEKQLVWRIAEAMRTLGAEPGFGTIVAAGPHGARPHHDPADRPIEAGEPIVIDMGAAVNGYTADLTRTLYLGDPSPEYAARYAILLAVQETALREIRSGMTGKEADAIAREALVREGLEANIIHGLGHGVGLNVHEYPSLSDTSDDVLQPGHVVTIEPGIYDETWGGIRIEDLCVVTETGLDILSAAPK